MGAEPPPERAKLAAPHEVVRIARRLEDAGFATWAVGGAVRDALAGGRAGDWDLTTAARPGAVQRLFRRTVPVGVEHGTVGILGRDGVLYEVTTFRRDVETFGRRARVVFADSLDEDLRRRDFTINTVAWHPLTHEVRDPHGGVADLRDGVLRTVGEPAERFREDRLRVLRALRFAGRFGLRVEPATWTALRAAAANLEILSPERVRDELRKTLAQVTPPSRSLRLYAESGVLAALFPELQACMEAGVWDSVLRTVDALPASRPALRLAALLARAGAPEGPDAPARAAAAARQLLQRLRVSNAERDRTVHRVAHLGTLPPVEADAAGIRRWLRRVDPEHAPDLLRLHVALCRADAAASDDLSLRIRRVRTILHTHPPLSVAELAIGGGELREMGVAPGPRYRQILEALLGRVIEDPALNRRDALLRLAEQVQEGTAT